MYVARFAGWYVAAGCRHTFTPDIGRARLFKTEDEAKAICHVAVQAMHDGEPGTADMFDRIEAVPVKVKKEICEGG